MCLHSDLHPYFICLGTMKLSTHNCKSFVCSLNTLILARNYSTCWEKIVNKVDILPAYLQEVQCLMGDTNESRQL